MSVGGAGGLALLDAGKVAIPALQDDTDALEAIEAKFNDADDDVDDDDEDSSSDSSDDDDDDDEADLLAELERIKAEREEERVAQEMEAAQDEDAAKKMEVLHGNPLTRGSESAVMKRRWDDDVVFKNQARGEPKVKKRFINDTIRNDFHRKFLGKYIQ